MKNLLLALATTLSFLVAATAPALAQDHGGDHGKKEAAGHSHEKAEGHGGKVTMTKAHHFEVVFTRDAVRVFLYDGTQNPIAAPKAKGTVKISFREEGRKAQTATLKYKKSKHGAHLHGKVDMSKVPEGDAKATFEISGLPGEESEVSFKETFQLGRLVQFACPMNCVPPTAKPGKCPKCGMALKSKKSIFACSMHPQVTGHGSKDKCWICGMQLSSSSGEAKGHDAKSGGGGDGGGGHGDHKH